MPYKLQPAVIGTAIRPAITGNTRSLEEIIYETSQAALADAGIAPEDIDGIIVGCNDQFDGRAISVMMASGPTGGVDRDILSTPSSSEHAFILGALRVASGHYRTQLVVAWSPTEASSLSEAQRLGADPYFHRALPLDELSAHALQAGAVERRVPGARDAAQAVMAKNRAHAARAFPNLPSPQTPGPARWPLSAEMTSGPTSGCVALVLAGPDLAAARNPAWVRGMGWATEPSFLGDRDLSTAPALSAAAAQAYAEAGLGDPDAIDLAEVTDATPYAELLAYEALRLCPASEWGMHLANGRFAADGRLPVNLSGGVLGFNPVFCTGLIRIAEVANQVRGRAGRHQHPAARLGLAHAGSGFAMQYQAAILLGREREARA